LLDRRRAERPVKGPFRTWVFLWVLERADPSSERPIGAPPTLIDRPSTLDVEPIAGLAQSMRRL
jgi:hypothetical protein